MTDPNRTLIAAVGKLTTQVRRIADAMLPLAEVVQTAATRRQTDYALAPTPTDDDVTTCGATLLPARLGSSGHGPCHQTREHSGWHEDAQGARWWTPECRPTTPGDDAQPTPYDGAPKVIGHWIPTTPEMHRERTEMSRLLTGYIDAQIAERNATVQAQTTGDDVASACRVMETRTCPQTYNGPCGDRPCARFESDDPAPWLSAAAPRLTADTITDEDDQRNARRQSLRILLNRLNNGVPLTPTETQLLTNHVATEICDANTGRRETSYHQQLTAEQGQAVTRANEAREQQRTRAKQAEATIERVRALHTRTTVRTTTGPADACSTCESDAMPYPWPCDTSLALDSPSSPVTPPDEPQCGAHVYHVNAGGATIGCGLTAHHHGDHQSSDVWWPDHVAIYPIRTTEQPATEG